MARYPLICSLSILLSTAAFCADEAIQPQEEQPVNQEGQISKISEAFGHLIGKNIETIGIRFDIAHVIKGLEDAAAGKDSPMTEAECVQAITIAQETAFKEQSLDNLEKADAFLAQNAKVKGIVVLEEGKLQYKVEQQGEGEEVQEHFSPLIRYTGRHLDGSVFGSSKEDEMISLDETIPGFSKGLVGMKEGEKRTLFIHPELAYGTSGYLPPNSLLTFEIEVVKANQPAAEGISSIPESNARHGAEIAREDIR
jgi:peptidylprolyl isomerase